MSAIRFSLIIAVMIVLAALSPQLVYGVFFSVSWLVGYNYGLMLSLFVGG